MEFQRRRHLGYVAVLRAVIPIERHDLTVHLRITDILGRGTVNDVDHDGDFHHTGASDEISALAVVARELFDLRLVRTKLRKAVEQPQKIFVAVVSWTWTSRPMTGSYLVCKTKTLSNLPRRQGDTEAKKTNPVFLCLGG